MEKTIDKLKAPGSTLDTVHTQMAEHRELAHQVTVNKEKLHELDKTSTHLLYFSQKSDATLIKNTQLSLQSRLAVFTQMLKLSLSKKVCWKFPKYYKLISITINYYTWILYGFYALVVWQHLLNYFRWDKVLYRLAERSRFLDRALKDAKSFNEYWTDLCQWLDNSDQLLDSSHISNNDPDKIKGQISKHKVCRPLIICTMIMYILRLIEAIKVGKNVILFTFNEYIWIHWINY